MAEAVVDGSADAASADALRVLVVDDEPHVRSLLRLVLKYQGFAVEVAEDGPAALRAVEAFKPDLIILDLMLPGIDGIEVAETLRGDPDRLIIMLTARDQTADKIAGLRAGGDDYMVKPFDPEELIARIHAVVRRRRPDHSSALHAGPIVLDQSRRTVTVQGEQVSLTRREYGLLRLFMCNPRQVLTRQMILDRVWGYDFFGDENNVEVYVGYLRRKLGSARDLIETVRGVGYCLNI
jgi:DNA-binding response OmpR family regulator